MCTKLVIDLKDTKSCSNVYLNSREEAKTFVNPPETISHSHHKSTFPQSFSRVTHHTHLCITFGRIDLQAIYHKLGLRF